MLPPVWIDDRPSLVARRQCVILTILDGVFSWHSGWWFSLTPSCRGYDDTFMLQTRYFVAEPEALCSRKRGEAFRSTAWQFSFNSATTARRCDVKIVRRQMLVVIASLAVFMLGDLAANCAEETAAEQAETPEQAAKAPDLTHYRLSGPYAHKNLAVYLIHTDNRDDREFLTLNEGLKSGLVKVTEMENEQVSSLLVENLSDKPLFLQEGDRVTGGKQDRTIYSSLAIAAKSGPQRIPSFCIEPSRWSGGKVFMHNANPGYASNSVRQAAKLSMNQGLVWERVGMTKQRLSRVLGTGNDTTSLNEAIDSKKIVEATKDFQMQLGKLLDEHKDAVGFAFAVNGEILEVNAFPGNRLAARIFPRLVETYGVDAVVAAVVDKQAVKNKAPAKDKVLAFMKTSVKKKAERNERINDDNQLVIFAGEEIEDKTKTRTFRCTTRYQGDPVHLQWIKAAKVDAPAGGSQQRLNDNRPLNPQNRIPQQSDNNQNPQRQQRK